MSGNTSTGEVTQLLASIRSGDRSALDKLTPLLYQELRRLADSLFRRERPSHTMQPTAVVHEAYVRLVNQDEPVPFATRAHFLGIAAKVMRHVLVDYSRARLTSKRGGGAVQVELNDEAAADRSDLDVMALHEALNQLAEADPRKAKVIEMRYFGGLNGDEIAEALDVGRATVTRDLRMAEAWLAKALSSAR